MSTNFDPELEFQRLRDQLSARDETWLATRIQALLTYGLMAVLVGVAMTFTGGPVLLENVFGSWTRAYFGIPVAVSGALILSCASRSFLSRSAWRTTLVGTVGFMLSAATLAGAYVWGSAQARVEFVLPGTQISPSSSRLYVPILYGFIAFLLFLHVIALVKLRPCRK